MVPSPRTWRALQPAEGTVVAERRLGGSGRGHGGRLAARHLSLDVPCAFKFLHSRGAELGRRPRSLRARGQGGSPAPQPQRRAGARLRRVGRRHALHRHGAARGRGPRRPSPARRPALPARHRTSSSARSPARSPKPTRRGIVHRGPQARPNIYPLSATRTARSPRCSTSASPSARTPGRGREPRHTRRPVRDPGLAPCFMSPEQARGLRVSTPAPTAAWRDHRVSGAWWGALPLTRASPLVDLFAKIITDPIPVPSQLRRAGGVPPGVRRGWWAAVAGRATRISASSPPRRWPTP